MHDYILASLGGLLIAVASTTNLLLKGRVTGFSGILYELWSGNEGNNTWRWALILGLFSSSSILRLASLENETFFENQENFSEDFSIPAIIISGLLVGFGTKVGNGCTSGHGVCGLPRFSPRSFVAVAFFLSFGIGIATIKHHFPFFSGSSFLSEWGVHMYEDSDSAANLYYSSFLGLTLLISLIYIVMCYKQEYFKENSRGFSDAFVGYIVGLIFGIGLCVSGMTKRSKIINFLAISSDWDASLMFVLGASVGINLITFYYILKKTETPLFSNKPLTLKTNWNINSDLILGPSLFGIGWGMSGLCPGPVMVNLFLYLPILAFFTVCIILGQIIAKVYLSYMKEPEKINALQEISDVDGINKSELKEISKRDRSDLGKEDLNL